MTSIHFQGKAVSITVIQVYAPTTNAKEAEVEWFYEDLQNLLSQGTGYKSEVKRYLANRQIWPWNAK